LNARYPYTDDIINYVLKVFSRRELQRDDILDALVAAVTAAGGSKSLASIPESGEIDTRGISMEMVFLAL